MKTLTEYLKALPDDAAREAFARDCETSLGHLRNIGYGYKPCATELAVAIEAWSRGEVTRKILCPDNWHRRWPELVGAVPQPTAEPQAEPAKAEG